MCVPSGHSRVLGEEHRESVVKKNISVSKSDTVGLNTSQVLLFPRDSTAEISETALEEDFSSGRRDAFEKDGKINTTRTLTNCLRFNKRLDMNFLVRKVQEVDILNPLCVSILKIYEACDAFFFWFLLLQRKGRRDLCPVPLRSSLRETFDTQNFTKTAKTSSLSLSLLV